jgi:hypothetical protein
MIRKRLEKSLKWQPKWQNCHIGTVTCYSKLLQIRLLTAYCTWTSYFAK